MTGKGKKRYLKTALCVLGVIVIASAILTGIYRKEIKLRYLIYKVGRGSYAEAVWAAGELGKMGEDAEAAIPELVQHMGVYMSHDPGDYGPFRKALINIGQPAIEYLKNYINDEKSSNRFGATLTLGLGGPECAAFLVEKLSDENGNISRGVLMGFTGMGGDDYNETLNNAKGALIRILRNDESPHNRRFAIYALRRVGPDEEYLEALCLALADEDFTLKEAAISALGRCGLPSRAVDCLKTALYDENDAARGIVVNSLGNIGPEPEVIDALIEAMSNDVLWVRRSAIKELVRFGADAEPALEKLRYLAENDFEGGGGPNLSISEEALKAIEEIEKAIDENREVVTESE